MDSDTLTYELVGAETVTNTGETQVNTTFASDQSDPSVAGLADGGYVVAWTSSGQDEASTLGVYAQRYDALGNTVGTEFLVEFNDSE